MCRWVYACLKNVRHVWYVNIKCLWERKREKKIERDMFVKRFSMKYVILEYEKMFRIKFIIHIIIYYMKYINFLNKQWLCVMRNRYACFSFFFYFTLFFIFFMKKQQKKSFTFLYQSNLLTFFKVSRLIKLNYSWYNR